MGPDYILQIYYPTELELKKENLIAILVPLFLNFTSTLKLENSVLDFLTNEITLTSTL